MTKRDIQTLMDLREIRGVHVNPRKRETDTATNTPVPEPKRQCIAVQCDHQGTTSANCPPTRVEEPGAAEVENTVDSESDTVTAKNATTIANAPDQKAESSRKTQLADEASPAETSRIRGMDMGCQGKPGDATALSLEARRKIITATLSRCYVAVYPVQTFADLIKQSGQDVKFSRHSSHTEHYCSQKIGSGATGFYIRFTQDAFEEIGPWLRHASFPLSKPVRSWMPKLRNVHLLASTRQRHSYQKELQHSLGGSTGLDSFSDVFAISTVAGARVFQLAAFFRISVLFNVVTSSPTIIFCKMYEQEENDGVLRGQKAGALVDRA
ncbi:hypothetical protein M406DRAFT_71463 [Cryphonectria parasitica EP155]|uniref:Uncharacterized protein n=1 Tax=Cryphonectria parasitica (strain ATCC 38755 / EP155) TaxID=660469 RepID=A0A9P4Y8G3_CRYP1|nr:uncharacterized protein M406DRAFT_71463 [Cryphonectria parasitica EP155]KAF3768458.1 hypothetical protein M406DRAFT_71463 [Cryphonectria parasitica EP155]